MIQYILSRDDVKINKNFLLKKFENDGLARGRFYDKQLGMSMEIRK